MFHKLFPFRRSKSDSSTPAKQAFQVEQLRAICERVARGDMEARIVGLSDDDPLAPFGRTINRMLDGLDAYVRESSAAMDHCSQGRFHRPILLRGLPGAFQNGALIINRGCLQMKKHSAQIATFETQRREAVDSVQLSIGAACQELSASAGEISRQTSHSAGLSVAAVKEAAQAAQSAQELTTAAETIKTVVKLITDLARQTNLIALNATIEAARAGEHGRGFAVVADEVKTLSRNTTAATATISGHVYTIEESIVRVRRAIETIAASVEMFNKNASVIDASVSEQVQATNEISRQIVEVAAAIAGNRPT
jgi:methyl-accepting chemotaxis protein